MLVPGALSRSSIGSAAALPRTKAADSLVRSAGVPSSDAARGTATPSHASSLLSSRTPRHSSGLSTQDGPQAGAHRYGDAQPDRTVRDPHTSGRHSQGPPGRTLAWSHDVSSDSFGSGSHCTCSHLRRNYLLCVAAGLPTHVTMCSCRSTHKRRSIGLRASSGIISACYRCRHGRSVFVYVLASQRIWRLTGAQAHTQALEQAGDLRLLVVEAGPQAG